MCQADSLSGQNPWWLRGCKSQWIRDRILCLCKSFFPNVLLECNWLVGITTDLYYSEPIIEKSLKTWQEPGKKTKNHLQD